MGSTETDLQRRIGSRVKAARESKGLTQAQVASQVGMTRSSIANLEAGRQDMNISRLALIAAAVGLDLAAVILPEDLPSLRPLPPPDHEVHIRRTWEVFCATCGGPALACHLERLDALTAKHQHIAAMRP